MEVQEIVRGILPNSRFQVGQGYDLNEFGGGFGFVMSIARAERELGYSPQYPLEKGLDDYIRYLQQASR